jgi:NAD(P)H dehydrogenase (quinone)
MRRYQLALVISEVTGANVTYRDLPAEEYAHALRRAGLDQATARFVADVDASIAAANSRRAAQT